MSLEPYKVNDMSTLNTISVSASYLRMCVKVVRERVFTQREHNNKYLDMLFLVSSGF